MDSYRMEAQKKYQEDKIKKERKSRELEEQKSRELEEQKYRELEEQKLEEHRYREMEEIRLEQERKNKDILHEWDTIILSLENDHSLQTEPLYSIYLCYSLINEIKETELLLEWKNRVVNLIHIINKIQEKRTLNQKINTDEVKQIEVIMKHLIEMTHLEVDIETMDTSLDEKMALELTQYEWSQDILNQNALNQNVLNQNVEVPIASLRRGVGLSLIELKQLAHHHGQKKSGSKEELINRLSILGLVRIIL